MQQTTIDYSRKWYVLVAVGMGAFMATLDGSIVNIAMPSLERIFNTNLALVQWVALAYLLTVTTLLLTIGRLADIIGKKPIYLTGFAIFTIGSGLCGLTETVHWLIGYRILQAIGAAMIMSLGPAIITEAFPSSERGKALGFIGMAVSAGIIAGPALGGMLIEKFSWHWIFLINIPVGIISILFAAKYVPATRPRGGQRFDYPGAVTMFISLLALLLALSLGQQLGFGEQAILALGAGWLIFLLLFVLIELRSKQPMIDLRLFRYNGISVNLISGLITFMLISGILFLMPFYLENVLGYNPLVAGQLLAVLPLALGLASPISGWLSDRIGTRPIIITGLLVMLGGYVMVSRLNQDTSTLGFILALMPIGLGIGIFQSPNNSAIIGAVPPHQLGVTSGLLAISRTLGQTAGIAALNAIWASRVIVHAHEAVRGEVTSAPLFAQVAGLHDTGLLSVGLIGFALLLNIWWLVWDRQLVLRQARTS